MPVFEATVSTSRVHAALYVLERAPQTARTPFRVTVRYLVPPLTTERLPLAEGELVLVETFPPEAEGAWGQPAAIGLAEADGDTDFSSRLLGLSGSGLRLLAVSAGGVEWRRLLEKYARMGLLRRARLAALRREEWVSLKTLYLAEVGGVLGEVLSYPVYAPSWRWVEYVIENSPPEVVERLKRLCEEKLSGRQQPGQRTVGRRLG